MAVFFVIIVLVVAIAMLSEASNNKKRQEEYQKVKTAVASTFQYNCRMLEALDILEDVLKAHDQSLRFYRNIGPSMRTNDTVFELQYVILRSKRNPLVQKALDSIVDEETLRTTAKNSGKALPTRRDPDNYTVWCDLTDKQVDLLYDVITDFNQRRDEDNDIVLEGSLLLRFDNPSGYNSYTYRVNMYVKALAEAIHERFPRYGFEADTYGIHFNDKNGVVSYKNI